MEYAHGHGTTHLRETLRRGWQRPVCRIGARPRQHPAERIRSSCAGRRIQPCGDRRIHALGTRWLCTATSGFNHRNQRSTWTECADRCRWRAIWLLRIPAAGSTAYPPTILTAVPAARVGCQQLEQWRTGRHFSCAARQRSLHDRRSGWLAARTVLHAGRWNAKRRNCPRLGHFFEQPRDLERYGGWSSRCDISRCRHELHHAVEARRNSARRNAAREWRGLRRDHFQRERRRGDGRHRHRVSLSNSTWTVREDMVRAWTCCSPPRLSLRTAAQSS